MNLNVKTEIREANFVDHEPEIIALWDRNFDHVPVKRFSWLYRSCPYTGASYQCLWTSSHHIVGGAGIVPRKMRILDSIIIAGQAVDLVVDRSYRSGGPAIKLHRRIMENAALSNINLLYGFPIPAAAMVLFRLHYKELGVYERWVKPIRYHYILRKRIPSWLSIFLSPIVDAISKTFSRDNWSHFPKDYCTELLISPDDRFDQFWKMTAPHYSIVGVRDREYLEWRFFNQPEKKRQIFAIVDEAKSLKAYLVFQMDEDNFIKILDFLVSNDNDCKHLLAAFIRFARNHKAQSISINYLGSNITKRLFRWAGFVQRDNNNAKVLVYTSENSFLDPQRWHLTDADRDN